MLEVCRRESYAGALDTPVGRSRTHSQGPLESAERRGERWHLLADGLAREVAASGSRTVVLFDPTLRAAGGRVGYALVFWIRVALGNFRLRGGYEWLSYRGSGSNDM